MAEAISKNIRDRGFLLKSVPYGDNHRILSILTESHGKVGLIAYSAQKSLRRFSGVLDFLRCLDLEFQHHSRGGLSQLLRCSLHLNFDWVGVDYEAQIIALEWMALLSRCLPEGQQVAGVFTLLMDSLAGLGKGRQKTVDLSFRRNLLSRLGFHMDLERCAACGTDRAGLYRLQLERGGLLCESCAPASEERWFRGPFPAREEMDSQTQGDMSELLDTAFEGYLGIIPDRKNYL